MDLVIAFTALDPVIAGPDNEGVVPGRSGQHVVEGRADNLLEAFGVIGPQTGVDLGRQVQIDGHALTGVRVGQGIGSSAADEPVIAAAALDDVVAVAAQDRLGRRAAPQNIARGRAPKLLEARDRRGVSAAQVHRHAELAAEIQDVSPRSTMQLA